MRWVLLALSVIGVLLMLLSRMFGWALLGIVLFVIGARGSTLALAQARIVERARPESLHDWQLQLLRKPSTDSSPH